MTKYRIQLDLTDDELNVLSKTLNEAYTESCGPPANVLLRIIEELDDAGDIAETLE